MHPHYFPPNDPGGRFDFVVLLFLERLLNAVLIDGYNRDFDEQERDARNKRIAEGKGDPEVDFEVAEADAADKGRSDQTVDGQEAIGRLDGDEFERDQEARNELEISSNC